MTKNDTILVLNGIREFLSSLPSSSTTVNQEAVGAQIKAESHGSGSATASGLAINMGSVMASVHVKAEDARKMAELVREIISDIEADAEPSKIEGVLSKLLQNPYPLLVGLIRYFVESYFDS